MSEFSLRYWVLRSPNNSYKSLTVVSSNRFPMDNVLKLFSCGGLFLQNGEFCCFLEQQYYFLETAASFAALGFEDIVAGVGDGVNNGPDAVSVVVGCDFLSTEKVWGFCRISTS